MKRNINQSADYSIFPTDLVWVAPEFIRESDFVGNQQGDVYSFAIVCSEVRFVSVIEEKYIKDCQHETDMGAWRC